MEMMCQKTEELLDVAGWPGAAGIEGEMWRRNEGRVLKLSPRQIFLVILKMAKHGLKTGHAALGPKYTTPPVFFWDGQFSGSCVG